MTVYIFLRAAPFSEMKLNPKMSFWFFMFTSLLSNTVLDHFVYFAFYQLQRKYNLAFL